MCIQFVRSGEMRNSYLEIDDKVEKDMNDYKTNWEKNFFKDNNDSEDYVNSILKADSNGNCIKQYIHYLIPFESSWIIKSDNISENNQVYDNIKKIPNNITEQKKIIIKYRVEWKNKTKNGNKNYPLGYLQGNPINIAFKDERETEYNFYERGFFITMSTKDGLYAMSGKGTIDENIISYPILFKRNGMFSCKIKDGNI